MTNVVENKFHLKFHFRSNLSASNSIIIYAWLWAFKHIWPHTHAHNTLTNWFNLNKTCGFLCGLQSHSYVKMYNFVVNAIKTIGYFSLIYYSCWWCTCASNHFELLRVFCWTLTKILAQTRLKWISRRTKRKIHMEFWKKKYPTEQCTREVSKSDNVQTFEWLMWTAFSL